eukprot:9991955-Prorocentrum_lima.AAC.1
MVSSHSLRPHLPPARSMLMVRHAPMCNVRAMDLTLGLPEPRVLHQLSLIHISEPTRLDVI